MLVVELRELLGQILRVGLSPFGLTFSSNLTLILMNKFAALTGGDYDLYLGEVRLTADFDPTVLIGPAGALNYSRWTDADTAALLSAYRAAQGDTRKTAAAQLCLRLGEQMPFAPLCFKNWSILSQWGQTAGASPTQQNIFHDFAQWEIAG